MEESKKRIPVSVGLWLRLGLGGVFDGIVLHQILQSHHMLNSTGFPADSLHNLKGNTLWDGIFFCFYVCFRIDWHERVVAYRSSLPFHVVGENAKSRRIDGIRDFNLSNMYRHLHLCAMFGPLR